jgi:hypothetical protein
LNHSIAAHNQSSRAGPVLGQAILAATLYVATLATLLHEVAAAAGYLVS